MRGLGSPKPKTSRPLAQPQHVRRPSAQVAAPTPTARRADANRPKTTVAAAPVPSLKKANSINPQSSSSGTILGLKNKRDAKQMGRKEHSNQKLTRQNSL